MYMLSMIIRLIANISILAGIYLFARTIYGAVNGSAASQLVHESQGFVWNEKPKPLGTADE
jgi:hypothetical protein